MECLIAVCFTLAANFNGGYAIEADYSDVYMKLEQQESHLTLTQGVKLEKGGLAMWYGFGSYVRNGQYQDSPEGYITESGIGYTLDNLFVQFEVIGQDKYISVGLSKTF